MLRRTRRTTVLPLTAVILLGTSGSALAIPNTTSGDPPPPPPNQPPSASLRVTPNPGLVTAQPVLTAVSARAVGDVFGRNPISFDASGSSDPDGTIAKYLWDLDGNGSFEKTTTTATTSRTYSSPGDYAVKVRVVDNGGRTADAATVLRIHRAPVARIAATPADVTAGQKATLSAAGSSDDNGIARYEWDLDGDGTYETDTATAPTVQAPFAAAGARTVRVRVTDVYGAASTAGTTVTVHPAPVAAFNASPAPAVIGERVVFDGTPSIRTEPVSKFEWDLDGDGTFETSTGARPTASRSFAAAGAVSTRLRITDARGARSVTTRSLTVLAQAPRDTLAPIVRIGLASSRMSRTGRVTLVLRCPAGERLCSGRLSLSVKGRSVGARRFRMGGGQRAEVRVLLKGAARRAVKRRHRLAVRAIATAQDAAGNTGTARRALRVRR